MHIDRSTQMDLVTELCGAVSGQPVTPELDRIVRTYGLWPFVGAIAGGATIGCALVEMLTPGHADRFFMSWTSALSQLWLSAVLVVAAIAVVLSYVLVRLVAALVPGRPRVGLVRLVVAVLVVISLPVILWTARVILIAFALATLWHIGRRVARR